MLGPVTLFLCRLTGFSKMGQALHQLRIADGVSGRKFYCCRMSYMAAAKDPVRRHSTETTQALVECLRAAEAHIDALCGLWEGLLNAAPSPGRQGEMRLTMTRYEIVVCYMHAIQTRAFDLYSNPTDARIDSTLHSTPLAAANGSEVSLSRRSAKTRDDNQP